MRKLKRTIFQVPIYDVTVVVVLTRDIPDSYKREFGIEIEDSRMACLGYHGRKFGIFLEPAAARRLEIVAHEIFHLTHRILEKCSMNFDESHHEMGAYLCEYLTKKIFQTLKITQVLGAY
jgi:hypothetical protein